MPGQDTVDTGGSTLPGRMLGHLFRLAALTCFVWLGWTCCCYILPAQMLCLAEQATLALLKNGDSCGSFYSQLGGRQSASLTSTTLVEPKSMGFRRSFRDAERVTRRSSESGIGFPGKRCMPPATHLLPSLQGLTRLVDFKTA